MSTAHSHTRYGHGPAPTPPVDFRVARNNHEGIRAHIAFFFRSLEHRIASVLETLCGDVPTSYGSDGGGLTNPNPAHSPGLPHTHLPDSDFFKDLKNLLEDVVHLAKDAGNPSALARDMDKFVADTKTFAGLLEKLLPEAEALGKDLIEYVKDGVKGNQDQADAALKDAESKLDDLAKKLLGSAYTKHVENIVHDVEGILGKIGDAGFSIYDIVVDAKTGNLLHIPKDVLKLIESVTSLPNAADALVKEITGKDIPLFDHVADFIGQFGSVAKTVGNLVHDGLSGDSASVGKDVMQLVHAIERMVADAKQFRPHR
ncbi:MAG: hypothetical protein OXF02_05745 [Simkaniaceae bacterium]|nr:hypothetical protein [Simkaniaceae bacterium]